MPLNPDYPQGSDDGRGLQQYLAKNPPQILSTLDSPGKASPIAYILLKLPPIQVKSMPLLCFSCNANQIIHHRIHRLLQLVYIIVFHME